jgi:dihydropteroate synthase
VGGVWGVGLGERLAGSLACACWAVSMGMNILRVHDVTETVQAVRMTEVLLAKRGGDRG